MKITTILLMAVCFTLTHAEANDIRVLVSNTTGARDHDPVVGAGYVVLPAPHVDLNVVWNAATQTFSGGLMTDSNVNGGGAAVPFGPEEAVAYLTSTGQRQRTNSSEQYDFQGAMGDTYWVFPSSATSANTAFSLYLGFSAYGVARDGTFTDNRIRWTVHSVENLTTPSATAFYGYSISAGNVNMQLTLDPAYPNREMTMLGNGHSHLNLLFKAAGMYRITFRARGTLVANGQEVSSLIPVYFGVESWEIPGAVQPPTGYDGWKLANFSSAQAADPAVSGLGADPDGDGADNLVEYAFGGNPTNAAGGLGPTVSTTNTSGTNWLRFAYRARTNDPALVIQPGFKVSLTETNWSTNVLVQKVSGQPAGDGVYEDQVWQTPLGADARRFLRLQISR
jgi:surface-anchored protein